MTKQKPFITQMQAEGVKSERDLIRSETHKEARALADKMPSSPPERLIYVRNLVVRALRKEISQDVLREFTKMTNSWEEIKTCLPRARQIVEKSQRAPGKPHPPNQERE